MGSPTSMPMASQSVYSLGLQLFPCLPHTPAWHQLPPGALWHLACLHQAGQTDHQWRLAAPSPGVEEESDGTSERVDFLAFP